MNMRITFPGGRRVDAAFGGHTLTTDQTADNGIAAAGPSPFDLFLASIGTCIGYYIMAFCSRHDLATDDIELLLSAPWERERKRVPRIDIAVRFPTEFPDRFVAPCLRAAEGCTVKRHLETPPEIHVIGEQRDATA